MTSNTLQPTYAIPDLPPRQLNPDQVEILKELALAHRYLAELKGSAKSIPNQAILIDTLALQEAKASSEIESYVTTQDELFQADLQLAQWVSPAAKEVARYREAMKAGFRQMQNQQGLLTNSNLITLFQILKSSSGGFRQSPGTVLKNERTGETVFVPPQNQDDIVQHMSNLERFINTSDDLDPIVKMTLIHHQFESIHPFMDGNGRVGRMLSVLYLSKAGLLDAPILYMSRYINSHKADYYRLLQAVRDQGNWNEWVLFMLRAVANTAKAAVELVDGMRRLMSETKLKLRTELPKIYSQDLLNNLFRHPYTRIEFLQQELQISRPTASKYLRELEKLGLLVGHAQGKQIYFINQALTTLLIEGENG
ncbi:Fic family protein [Limnobacter litoralis]|uniref:Addiction module protein n=1 Tax=Limnobacter litoralis TaxID=481366 RepID=A0ABQ5YR24_9BURK|nr:Fic family protein [Limnobacter litoralis]GLR27039.1 addiction module protein [Limnobacter litoralis]